MKHGNIQFRHSLLNTHVTRTLIPHIVNKYVEILLHKRKCPRTNRNVKTGLSRSLMAVYTSYYVIVLR